ncbi:unnamed protein product [Symbiodinium sp. CCMP2456]|nr:unnamed protein product [Symbiodinium sp. CCMP2456]
MSAGYPQAEPAAKTVSEASTAASDESPQDCAEKSSSKRAVELRKEAVEVVIGTSEDKHLARKVAELCNEAYGYRRLSENEAKGRLAMGDDEDANRVLHLAFRGKQLVGCCSSTLQPPWTPRSCGHWGLLSVHPEAQGTGVASALIAAAERRLFESGCCAVQIEYEYTAGEESSVRLLKWYEGRCGFRASSPPPRRGSEFRCCRKKLTPETVYTPGDRAGGDSAVDSAVTDSGKKPAEKLAEPSSEQSEDESSPLDYLPVTTSEEEEEPERPAAKVCRVL